MRIAVVSLLLALGAPALAQSGAPLSFDLSSLGLAPQAEVSENSRWLLEDTTATRFVDTADPGPNFDEAETVTVLFTEGDRVRVRKGDRYGWVDAAQLTDVPPAAPAAAPAAAPSPGGTFDLGQLKDLLDRTGDPQ